MGESQGDGLVGGPRASAVLAGDPFWSAFRRRDLDAVKHAEHSYDPFLGSAQDPEWDREPTRGVPDRSQTMPLD